MTVKEIAEVMVDSATNIVVNKGEEVVADFQVAYTDSIVDDILDMEISAVEISAGSSYKKGTTLTVYETSEDTEPGEEEPDDDGDDGDGNDGDGNDGDEGGDTEPDDENP